MLFLITTPIGNINDFTQRAIDYLKNSDYIYVEDTRVFRKLTNILKINTTKNIRVFNLINENDKTNEIIDLLKSEMKVSIVSDAGHPLIADPGYKLVKRAITEGIDVIPTAGPCAIILALVKSGLKTNEFTFYGFMKVAKNKDLMKQIDDVKKNNRTAVFYISKHDLKKIETILTEELSDFDCVIVRELTKIYETIYKGKGHDIISKIDEKQKKGEFVLLIEGKEKKKKTSGLLLDLYKIASPNIKMREKAKLISKITSEDSKKVYKELSLFNEKKQIK